MDLDYLFLVVSFSAAIFSALFCLILILLKVCYTEMDFFSKRLSIALISFYFVCIVFFVTVFLYVFDLKIYWWFKALNFQSILIIPVIFYHVVFKLSRLKKDERFNYYHYVVCFAIGISYLVYSEFIVKQETIIDQANVKNYLFFDNGRIIVRIIYNSLYLVLGLKRLIRYRQNIINYSSDDSQNSLSWLYNIFVIGFFLFPGPILFYSIPDLKNSLLYGQLIPNFLFMLFNITLCYNIFSQNFNLVYEDIVVSEPIDDDVEQRKIRDLNIDKEFFEQYIKDEKPFLDPQLKITDLLADLTTNRTYLSIFINATYNMNFSQYINRCRFHEYLDLKESIDSDDDNDELDIILASGFRSYKSFTRTKAHYYRRK